MLMPELHWSYVRGGERQQCQLALDPHQRAYEFRVWGHDSRLLKIERYPFACDAIQRQSEYESQLVRTGFSLESFCRRSAPDPSPPPGGRTGLA